MDSTSTIALPTCLPTCRNEDGGSGWSEQNPLRDVVLEQERIINTLNAKIKESRDKTTKLAQQVAEQEALLEESEERLRQDTLNGKIMCSELERKLEDQTKLVEDLHQALLNSEHQVTEKNEQIDELLQAKAQAHTNLQEEIRKSRNEILALKNENERLIGDHFKFNAFVRQLNNTFQCQDDDNELICSSKLEAIMTHIRKRIDSKWVKDTNELGQFVKAVLQLGQFLEKAQTGVPTNTLTTNIQDPPPDSPRVSTVSEYLERPFSVPPPTPKSDAPFTTFSSLPAPPSSQSNSKVDSLEELLGIPLGLSTPMSTSDSIIMPPVSKGRGSSERRSARTKGRSTPRSSLSSVTSSISKKYYKLRLGKPSFNKRHICLEARTPDGYWQCLCGKVLKYKRALQNHTRNANLEPKFQCKDCLRKPFLKFCYLKKHAKVVHNNSLEGFVDGCEFCGEMFRDIETCWHHRMDMHDAPWRRMKRAVAARNSPSVRTRSTSSSSVDAAAADAAES